MTVGLALLLIAAGAVLRFAISTVSTHGVNLHTIGDILMAVGVVGLMLWLAVWAPWARSRRSSYPANSAAGQQGPQGPAYPERRQVPPTDARTRDLYRADDPYDPNQYRR
jgi:hypothetical protein